MNESLWDYIRHNPDVLLQRDFLIELFMIPERLMLPETTVVNTDKTTVSAKVVAPKLYVGKLCVYQGKFWVITQRNRVYDPALRTYIEEVVASPLSLKYDPKQQKALLTGQTPVTLVPGDLACIKKDDKPIVTTFGRYLIHAVLICPLFGDAFPYKNAEIKSGYLNDLIVTAFARKIASPMDVKRIYVDRFCFLTYITELTVPGITRKALAKPESFDKERERLCKLYEKELARGDGTKMVEIEKHMEALNDAYMKGDESEHIFIDKKSRMSQKQLFLTTGLTEIFGEPGRVTFVAQPLGQGWKKKDVITLINDGRQGSYFRGIETANGGEDAKNVSLVLQDTYITEPDCGTTRGEVYEPNVGNYKELRGKYLIGKDPQPLTEEMAQSYIGKKVMLRSPQYCENKTGYCARCMGQIFEIIGQQAISMAVKNLSSRFTSAALKKIHATEKAVYRIEDLDQFRAKN